MNIALIIVLVLLLGANRQKKYPVKVVYEGWKPHWYDYDWRVRAFTPVRQRLIIGDTRTSDDHISNTSNEIEVNRQKEFYKKMESDGDIFDVQYELGETLTDWMNVKYQKITLVFIGYITSSVSQSWDFNNTPEFFASQAEQTIQNSYERAVIWAADPMNSNYEPIPPEEWSEPTIVTTKKFNDYYDKDMKLDAFLPMLKDLIIKAITKKIT